MPFAVTHILVPMILIDFARDHLFKIKKQFLPNKYVLLAGLFGLMPDIDMPSVLFSMPDLHGTVTHSIIFPTAFFIGFLISYLLKKERTYKIFFDAIYWIFLSYSFRCYIFRSHNSIFSV